MTSKPLRRRSLKNLPRGVISRFRRFLEQNSRGRYVEGRLKKSQAKAVKARPETILFFSPEAGFKTSSVMQCVLGRILKDKGHNVLVSRCYRLFERCPVMDMDSLPYNMSSRVRKNVCIDCAAMSFELFDDYELETLDLRTLLTPKLQSKYEQAVAQLPDDLLTFEFESIPFGKFSLLDLVLNTKVSDFNHLGKEYRSGWESYIKSSVLSFLLAESVCETNSISRLIHVSNYSLQMGAHFAARKHSIPVYSIVLAPHKANDRRNYIVLPELMWESMFRQGRAWKEWRDLFLAEDQVKEIGDDVLVRLGGCSSHTYSLPKNFVVEDIRSSLGLSTNRKLIVAYTSSLDELLALDVLKESIGLINNPGNQPFRDQIDWLQQVINFVNSRTDVQLVVRVHPREGTNRRESIISQHLLKLKETFGHEIPNCHFVWPEDPISSYDLAEAADLVLTSWSTIGIELARLGAPVITSTSGVVAFPHDDFLEFGETPTAYFDKLSELLNRPTNIETIARAFRWYYLSNLGTSVNLGDLIPRHDVDELPPFKMPAEAGIIEKIIIGGEHPLNLNHERLRGAQTPDSARQETLALQAQLRRIIHFFHTGQDSNEPARLFLLPSADANGSGRKQWGVPEGARVISLVGNQTRYVADGKLYSRYSPMCARLTTLCAEATEHIWKAEMQAAGVPA
ncbi:MAG TPA: hypothetical protein VK557_13110 [Pyrinomonadaceae bacterium]|nr:hypothetical protein [Pyrinomonadaceae bacterium]